MEKVSLFKGRYLAALILLPVLLIAGTDKAAAAGSAKNKTIKHRASTQIINKKTKRNKKVLAHKVVYKRFKNGNRLKYISRVYLPASGNAPAAVNTPAVPASTPIAAPPSGYSIEAIANAINGQRRANGVPEVSINNLLNQAAANKSQDMSNQHYFAHTNPQGKSDFTFIDEVGYRYQSAGSNLAQGDFGGSAALVNAWMNSPGHRANILAPFGQEIGIGISGNYFTMFITKPV